MSGNYNSQNFDLTSSIILHEETIQVDHLNSNSSLQLLVLSDLHCNSQNHFEMIEKTIHELKSSRFDIISILGDLTEDESYLRKLFNLFQKLDTKYGIFLVRSNHDYEGGRSVIIEQLAQEYGITLLNNKSFYIQELNVTLIGTERPWFKTEIDVESSGTYIGLSHTQDNIKFFSQLKTDIVLAGHTHGGKVQIPLIGSILVPSLYGRFLDYGWFKYNETAMFITKGIGYFPGRFGSKGEVLKLLMKKRKYEN